MNTQQIPLSQLKLSTRNVRRTAAGVDDMVASIAAHGLWQNLIVVPNKGKDSGFDVVAGSRRLRAMQQLQESGALPGTLVDGVPCMVLDAGDCEEVSLVENVVRLALHPADEFDAFRALVERDVSPAQVGQRFGKSERYVQQRLRLANVAPEILDEYRKGEATLEQMMALALVDDHKAQRDAWKPGKKLDEWLRRPDHLRRVLIEKDIPVDRGIGKFVGVDAYRAAGGEPREDLFGDTITLPDGKLVRKIATEKLKDEANRLKAKGWGWVQVLERFDWEEQQKYKVVSGAKPEAKYGVVLTLGHDGRVEQHLGLLKPGEKGPAKKKATTSRGGMLGSKEREARDQLTGIRTGAVRAMVRNTRQKALALLAASMAAARILGHKAYNDPAQILLMFEGNTYESVAAKNAIAITDPHGAKDLDSWLVRVAEGAKKAGGLLPWFLALGEDALLKALQLLIAAQIDTDNASGDDLVPLFVGIEQLGVEISWKPDEAWLAKQSRDYVLAAVVEAKGKGADAPLAKLKLADLAKAALPLLIEAKWLPQELRAPAPKKAAAKKPAKKAGKKGVKRAAAMPMAPVAPAM